MNEYINGELIENTYLFCVKRVSDSEAAKDLAQDILYEAVRALSGRREITAFYSWYWKMARNRLYQAQAQSRPAYRVGGRYRGGHRSAH